MVSEEFSERLLNRVDTDSLLWRPRDEAADIEQFTDKEATVVGRLALGTSFAEMSADMGTSLYVPSTIVQSAGKKLRVGGHAQVYAVAEHFRFVELPGSGAYSEIDLSRIPSEGLDDVHCALQGLAFGLRKDAIAPLMDKQVGQVSSLLNNAQRITNTQTDAHLMAAHLVGGDIQTFAHATE